MKKDKVFKILFASLCLTSIAIILFAIILRATRDSRIIRCEKNLERIGKAMILYKEDLGRNTLFPPYSGAGFLTILYRENFIQDANIFLCPNTWDNNTGENLVKILNFDKDNENFVSFSGRKNKNQTIYPGMFILNSEFGTVIAADDIQGTKNHDDIFNILFDHGSVKRVNSSDIDFNEIFDPLTN